MSQKQTSAVLYAKAAEYKAKIDSGRLTPAKLKRARTAYHNFSRRAKKRALQEGVSKAPVVAQKRIEPVQDVLPNFLAQLDVVHIEELLVEQTMKSIRERALNRISKELGVPASELLLAVAR